MPDSAKPATAAPRALFDHIAFGVPSIDAAPAFLVKRLGGRPYARGPGRGFVWKQWRFAGGGVLEVLEPAGPPGGFLHRFLAQRGAGVHHVTFKVPELGAAVERATALGYDAVGFDDSLPGWKECFLHPKQAQGIVVQLAESDPTLDDGSEYVTKFGPDDVEPGPAVTMVGLQLSARSAGAARRQWGELLGGACTEVDGMLHFGFPDSPMRISVRPDPAREEGPAFVELASDRELALPSGPEPALGVEFRNQRGRRGRL